MDEYAYLEQQLEAPKAEALPPPPAAAAQPEHKESRRDKERKSSRRSRSRSKGREREHRRSSRKSRSRSRERRDRDRDRHARERGEVQHRPHVPARDMKGDAPPPPYPMGGRDRSRDRGFPMPPPRVREPLMPDAERMRIEKEQELRDLERTVRTVMVMNLNLKAEEQEIFGFFAVVGGINDIKLIRDKNTRRSKGIAYIEYQSVESAMNALALNGQVFMGMTVMVKPSEAEKNMAWEAQQDAKKNQAASLTLLNKMGGQAAGGQMNPIKVQILNLHPDIGEDDLKDLFVAFGEINYVRVVRDPTGMSTGEAYVQYADQPMAESAIRHYNGFELGGRKLQVQVAPVYNPGGLPSMPPPAPAVDPVTAAAAARAMAGAQPAFGMNGLPFPPGQVPQPGTDLLQQMGGGHEMDDLDESESRPFKLNAQSRASLMARLATSAGLQAPPTFLVSNGMPVGQGSTVPAAPVMQVPQTVLMDQGLLGPASPIPTPCILLKNMFTDADKVDANWQQEVADDVKGEASKFGEIVHVHVEPNSKGHVYLKFAAQQGAEAAQRALHGRYYSGNQIVVAYQFLPVYNQFFGLR